MSSRITIVVPTLGRSPDLEEAAARLREEASSTGAALLWVGPAGAAPAVELANERAIITASEYGFARAANCGIGASGSESVALVNDDVVVEPGWLVQLLDALESDRRLGAVQGVQLRRERPELCDGAGIEWSPGWRAIQIGHDRPPPAVDRPFELFGVSATAALYRRHALDDSALAAGLFFDPRLVSWYEDVDLAGRLRARGWGARCVPSARALHRGSATGEAKPFERALLLTRNRWLVVARLLGRRFPAALPRLVAGDLRAWARALAGGELRSLGALPLGMLAALVALPRFVRGGPPLVASAEIARLRVGSAS